MFIKLLSSFTQNMLYNIVNIADTNGATIVDVYQNKIAV